MRKSILIVAGLLVVAVVSGFAVLYGGFYNVAASKPHNSFMRWLLETGMRYSVAAHAPEIEPPDLADPALIVAGARHFEAACVQCHGAPGVTADPIAEAMLPRPPALGGKVDDFEDNELFWIILNGLKYTGMPGWPDASREDEVWDMVAFVRLLPEMTASQYAALTPDPTVSTEVDAVPPIVLNGGDRGAATACAGCHGLDGQGDPGGAFPNIAGLPLDYIREQLEAFVTGERPSGIMRAALIGTEEEDRAAAAQYYADQEPDGAAAAGDPNGGEGAAIAYEGLPGRDVPPCATCHLDPENNAPSLAGQYADYIRTQLELFRAGVRTDNVMTMIAADLTDGEIEALAAFFAAMH